jgi:hypothetical protein
MTTADISAPLSTPGISTITSISMMGFALPDQEFKEISRPMKNACVNTAAITGWRSFPLRIANATVTAQTKGFIEK